MGLYIWWILIQLIYIYILINDGWLMLGWGITAYSDPIYWGYLGIIYQHIGDCIVIGIHYPSCTGDYNTPRMGNLYKPTRIKWNDRGSLNTAQLSWNRGTSKSSKSLVISHRKSNCFRYPYFRKPLCRENLIYKSTNQRYEMRNLNTRNGDKWSILLKQSNGQYDDWMIDHWIWDNVGKW